MRSMLINNHETIVDMSIDLSRNDAHCIAATGRPSEYSAAARRLVIGEIINLSAQYAALREQARFHMAVTVGETIPADQYL